MAINAHNQVDVELLLSGFEGIGKGQTEIANTLRRLFSTYDDRITALEKEVADLRELINGQEEK